MEILCGVEQRIKDIEVMKKRGLRIVTIDQKFVDAGLKALAGFQLWSDKYPHQIPDDIKSQIQSFKESFLKLVADGYC